MRNSYLIETFYEYLKFYRIVIQCKLCCDVKYEYWNSSLWYVKSIYVSLKYENRKFVKRDKIVWFIFQEVAKEESNTKKWKWMIQLNG